MRLAEALVGVWNLEKHVELKADVVTGEPFGSQPKGLLIYTADGFMSAHLIKTGYEHRGEGLVSYSGTYAVDETQSVVTHTPIVSFDPDWIGHPQERLVTLIGDRLTLTTMKSYTSDPQARNRLTWRRL